MKNLFLAILVTFCFSGHSFAGPFTLPTLTPSQADGVFQTMAADNIFRSVQGADTFGTVFGFGVGLTAQQAATTQMNSLISGTPAVYSANIDAELQLPLGIAIEAGFLPNMNLNGATINRTGGDIKWTMTKTVFSSLPFAMALRGIYTKTDLSYSQGLSGGTVNVGYSSTLTGATLAISKSFVVIEPYISYGLVSHNSSLSGSGTANLYSTGVSSVSGTGSSGYLQIGAELKLLVLNVGLEYGSLFGTDTYAARVGFKF